MVPKRCGENVGKENRKTLAERTLRGFLVPRATPIYEVLSSHCARKAFSGNMYDKVPDPNLICPLTGHKEGSKSFARYRMIDEDTNRKTVSLLE